MRRRLAVLIVVAGLVSVAGCGERTAAATPAPSAVATDATDAAGTAGDAGVSAVESAVTEAERLLASIDAELAADDAGGG